MRINRRHALTAMVGGSVASGLVKAQPNAQNQEKSGHFAHGVASGDPLSDRFIIWTRISSLSHDTKILWQVATDQAFKTIVKSGAYVTGAMRDFTVKIDVTGLMAGTTYFYRFQSAETYSVIGRAQTLPRETQKVVMAVASCSLHPNGYFNAYRAIADLKRVDCVVHLGDYIYEYGAGVDDYGMKNGAKLGRIPVPAHEMLSLYDYRARHAQYKADPDLQAAHARAAWICVFDDHEITNNPWTSGAENHNPEKGEGDFLERKARALKAYAEWMPIRDPEPGKLAEAIYRSFRFGSICELMMLETRLLARTKELSHSADMPQKTNADGTKTPDLEGFERILNDESRQLMGATQRQWLQHTMQQSVKSGVAWQVLGNQVIMARVPGPDLTRYFGADLLKGILASLNEGARGLVQSFIGLFSPPKPLPFNLDAWDGYPAERERLYDMVKDSQSRLVVISGDSHTAWSNQLHDAKGQQVGVEFGATSITSPTRWLDDYLPSLEVAKCVTDQADEVIAANDDHNGFLLLSLTHDDVTCDWMKVDTILERDFKTARVARFRTKALKGRAGPLQVI